MYHSQSQCWYLYLLHDCSVDYTFVVDKDPIYMITSVLIPCSIHVSGGRLFLVAVHSADRVVLGFLDV